VKKKDIYKDWNLNDIRAELIEDTETKIEAKQLIIDSLEIIV
jgi:hypothetical protein